MHGWDWEDILEILIGVSLIMIKKLWNWFKNLFDRPRFKISDLNLIFEHLSKVADINKDNYLSYHEIISVIKHFDKILIKKGGDSSAKKITQEGISKNS